jgi:hypothetical protein
MEVRAIASLSSALEEEFPEAHPTSLTLGEFSEGWTTNSQESDHVLNHEMATAYL